MLNYESNTANACGQISDSTDVTPCYRTINSIDGNLDQLVDTITSLEKVLSPGLRHAVPEAQKTGADAREAGLSPIHERLLDMQSRIQHATRSVAELRNRVTL